MYECGEKVLVEMIIKDSFTMDDGRPVYIMAKLDDTHLSPTRPVTDVYLSPAENICVFDTAVIVKKESNESWTLKGRILR